MKTYEEIKNYFEQMSTKELLDYYNECKTIINPNDFKLVRKVVEYCFGKVNKIHLQIDQLNWYLIDALAIKLEKQYESNGIGVL